MSTRKKGCSQVTSAAKSGISERSGRRAKTLFQAFGNMN